jgi:hypothetical protein
MQQEKWAEAEAMLRECLTIRETKEPETWTTFGAMSLLGSSLVGQKRFEEAEPLLLKGYEGMKQREEKIPKTSGPARRILDAIDRLIEFYTAMGKPDEVKKWQAERARYSAMPRAGKKS